MCLPYETVPHAGGKTFHYYLNSFASEPENEITLITKVLEEEKKCINKLNTNIRLLAVSTPERGIRRYWGYVKSFNSKFNPFYKFGNTLTKEIYDQIKCCLKQLKQESYSPDIIVLEWTEMLLFVSEVKKYFPKAKYVASEHDVSYLRLEREMKMASEVLKRTYKKWAYHNLRKRELAAINNCDLVVTHNRKDYELLVHSGIQENKLDVITPYFDDYSYINRCSNGKDILFFGAMNRIENTSAVMWFLEKVWEKLEDLDVRFIIVGNKPPKELLDKQNERVLVTGFVEDVSEYFKNAMCLVAPLQLGAGVKVKIIEALSAGIPVLTNQIGIEGILAENGVQYLHCEEPEEYERRIRQLVNGEIDVDVISGNARKLISDRYCMEVSFQHYSEKIYLLDVKLD